MPGSHCPKHGVMQMRGISHQGYFTSGVFHSNSTLGAWIISRARSAASLELAAPPQTPMPLPVSVAIDGVNLCQSSDAAPPMQPFQAAKLTTGQHEVRLSLPPSPLPRRARNRRPRIRRRYETMGAPTLPAEPVRSGRHCAGWSLPAQPAVALLGGFAA